MARRDEMRETHASLRGALKRLDSPHATVFGPLDRLNLMQRHMDEIGRSVRMGLLPEEIHLVQLAAMSLKWHAEIRNHDRAIASDR